MGREKGLAEAARAIMRALDGGADILRLGETEDAVMLALRRRGEAIDDPECDGVYEALSGGVFRRYRTISAGREGWKWVFFCPAIPEMLERAMERDFARMDDAALDAVRFDVAFQAMRGRERRTAGSTS